MTPAATHRRIRSFVRREGRMTPAQKRDLAELWPRYGLSQASGPVDWLAVFGRDATRTLEIGFGNGDNLFAQALANPRDDFIGIEVHRPGVGRLLGRLGAAELANVRVFCADAVEVLDTGIPSASIDCVQLYFPDPWPKTRHHKRRIVQAGFAERVARVLKPGGRWLLATDWRHYAEQMCEVLNAHPDFDNLAADRGFVPRPPERIETKFERRGLRLGHAVFDLAYRRK